MKPTIRNINECKIQYSVNILTFILFIILLIIVLNLKLTYVSAYTPTNRVQHEALSEIKTLKKYTSSGEVKIYIQKSDLSKIKELNNIEFETEKVNGQECVDIDIVEKALSDIEYETNPGKYMIEYLKNREHIKETEHRNGSKNKSQELSSNTSVDECADKQSSTCFIGILFLVLVVIVIFLILFTMDVIDFNTFMLIIFIILIISVSIYGVYIVCCNKIQ